MSHVARKEPKKTARRIKHRRDYEAASAIARNMSERGERDSAAERRLQSLLHELERFDAEGEAEGELLDDGLDAGLRRRWSDEADGE